MSIETRSQELADLLVTRNFEPEYFKAGRAVTTAQDADMFSFDYVGASGRNYGTVVIMFQEDDTFLLLASNNMARGMEDADADVWFGFLNQLKQWAVSPGTGFRNFSIENIAKLRHHQAGMAAIREGLFEGYYGTRHISYVGEATQARLMIRHKRPLGEGDARHRQIDSLFLETADGERYRLPFRQLAGGRAMLEHVRAGGRPWDVRGVHITEMVSELAVLSRFRRASAGRVLEGISQQVVESAAHYYDALRESIRRLGSSRGYADYFESWTPADIGSHEELVEDIRQLFVEQTLDARIESALPLLARIQQKENSMKELKIFEAWTDRVMEGTWELPETPEQLNQLRQLLSQPLTVGVDAMDATEQLGGLVGDDELFDRLTDLADRDPNANAWDDSAVMDRMWELADASPELADALTQIGTPTGPEDDQPGMAEALGDLRPKLGSRRDQGKSIRKWRKARGLDESGVAEGLAQDEAEKDSGWRAEFVNEINYNTFEVKVTNARSKESANFIIRPVDMISMGLTLDIETMDVRDLQTGQTESWTKDDPAPDGPIANAIGSLFYDDKQLQKKLWNIVDTHDNKGLDMMPGLEKRRSIGQEVDADAYIDSGEKTQAAMAKMKKGLAEDSLNELSTDLLQRSAQVAKHKSKQAMDPEIHDALGGGYKNPLARHYDSLSQKFDRGAEKAKKRNTAKTISSIASPAVMRKIGLAEQGMSESASFDLELARLRGLLGR